ncbi:HEAT repeat domain-containing protein [Streptomyces sp. SAS_270]|uniref:HEAT repeat domain-containing protein n=1 Tax=Streptomyces sp. SAS_270 TaxID=3412748 RepID=UPI00403C24B1
MDEVDWAAMRHAYGSADKVPDLLRGLASSCPDERESALDGMYGAVHHQGDVYDSTLACIPFLFALITHPEVPDRGALVELLVSIGGGDADESFDGDDRKDEYDDGDEYGNDGAGAGDNYAMARAAIRAGAAVFAELIEDRDPEVRRAAPCALVRFLDEPARVLGLLGERMETEPDRRVRPALVEGLGLFARRHPAAAAPAVDSLVALSVAPGGPGERLAALGQLAGCAPERLPSDLAPTVIALLRARSQEPAEPEEPERPATDTLIGQLRVLRPADEEGSRLLRTLHSALGDRTADRIALLNGQLRSEAPADRCNAVWMSAGLFREWRASYEKPIALIGEQLDADDTRLREAAVHVLDGLFELAAPAADHLAAAVAARPESWVRHWEHGAPTLGDALKTLARTGDPRTVPPLLQLLKQPVVPYDLGRIVEYVGPAAAPLAPLLRTRLGDVPLDADTYDRAAPLLLALSALRHEAAVPEVLRLLPVVPDEVPDRSALVEAAVRTLGAFGPAAHEAIPALRDLLTSDCAATAAAALWSVEEDAKTVLPVLLRELTSERPRQRQAAAEALGRLGASAGAAVPALRGMAGTDDAGGGRVWERTAAACALWDITGAPEPILPVLRHAWHENPYTRGTIAACLSRMGRAATPAHDLLRTELGTTRRHLARSGGYGGGDILEDERLLRICRQALETG